MPVHPGPQPFPLLRIPSLDAKDSDLQLHECQRGDIKARRVPARDPCGDTGVGLAVSDFAQLGDYIRGPAQTSEKIGIRFEGPQDLQTKVMITLFAKKLGRPKGSLGVSRLDGREDEIRHFLHRQDHRRHPPDALQLHRHPRAEGRCLESLHERCRYPDMEDDLKRTVCSFCGAHAQSSAPQGWFSAELEHVVDEDEEIATVEVWEAVACPDCEGQIRMTATHLEAQGWQPVPDPL